MTAPHLASSLAKHRAVLICYRCPLSGQTSVEWTYWDTYEQAHEASAELTPCGPLCVGLHTVARLDLPPDPRGRPGYEPKPSRRKAHT